MKCNERNDKSNITRTYCNKNYAKMIKNIKQTFIKLSINNQFADSKIFINLSANE